MKPGIPQRTHNQTMRNILEKPQNILIMIITYKVQQSSYIQYNKIQFEEEKIMYTKTSSKDLSETTFDFQDFQDFKLEVEPPGRIHYPLTHHTTSYPLCNTFLLHLHCPHHINMYIPAPFLFFPPRFFRDGHIGIVVFSVLVSRSIPRPRSISRAISTER